MKKWLFLLFVWPGLLSAAEKYALLIGINDYKSPSIADLKYSEPDARYLHDVLVNHVRVKPENIRMLLGANATTANIKREVYWLSETAHLEDKVFFYFSGHGSTFPDKHGDEDDDTEEAFCPYETELRDASTVISDDDFGIWFNGIQAQEIFVILDCCYSGGAAGKSLESQNGRGIDLGLQPVSTSRSILDQGGNPYARDLGDDNKFIITASDADERSFENPAIGHGIFTYYLGEALRGKADLNNDKAVTTGELFSYTRDLTAAYARQNNLQQTPHRFGALGETVMTLTNNQAIPVLSFDPDLKIIVLGAGRDLLKEGDLLMVKKRVYSAARDLDLGEEAVFKVRVYQTLESGSKAEIVANLRNIAVIDPGAYDQYYAEQLATGSIAIQTVPWSTIFLDGKEIGPSPCQIVNVPVGEHEIEMRPGLVGYTPLAAERLVVSANQTVKLIRNFARSQ